MRHCLLRCTAATLLCILFLCGCAESSFLYPPAKDAGPMVRNSLQIDNTEQAVTAVLSYATPAFIGYHPVDESFLFWVDSTFNNDCLTTLARYTDFNDPEIWYATTGNSIHVLWWDYCNVNGIACEDNGDVYAKEAATESEIVLDFCGDLSMAADVATTTFMEQQPRGLSDCFSEGLLAEMRSADIFVLNNEFVFSDRGEPTPNKAYTFRANPAYVGYLSDIGVDLVTLANNHVFDFGPDGLFDTLDTLKAAQIPYVGAGRNFSEAAKPAYFIIGGRKLAIVNATQIERSYPYTQEATAKLPGVLKTLKSEKFVKIIREAKKHADYVIVCVHWGTEGNAMYGRDQVALAKDFVEAGADAIVGSHTHCLQGIEYIGDVPVWYSLGNYWFSLNSAMPADYDTGLARIRIRRDGILSYEFVPCRFSNGVTSLIEDDNDIRKNFNYIEHISKTTSISDDGTIRHRE